MIQRRVKSEQDFINQVDPSSKQPTEDKPSTKKGRKFISHTIQMNEEEYQLLKELAHKYCQSHSGIIRYALKALAEQK
ncbi:Ribbon-helix-helix protein, copG family [Moraxella lacunata]|uniref:Ribbon-helix-helix protein, copG family n=1 Tax=Moraxella lacunata TaxID=477 RepID=A0A1V4GYN1_MORLA|nr:hypothetical protein [Moraxella lacunata]OPH37752.1 hypothetical protein B5J94_05175 [Moraxella lacunata]STZ74881.1 Ribbon-helix-helix protein, copG family [Moraxella lacunata]